VSITRKKKTSKEGKIKIKISLLTLSTKASHSLSRSRASPFPSLHQKNCEKKDTSEKNLIESI